LKHLFYTTTKIVKYNDTLLKNTFKIDSYKKIHTTSNKNLFKLAIIMVHTYSYYYSAIPYSLPLYKEFCEKLINYILVYKLLKPNKEVIKIHNKKYQ